MKTAHTEKVGLLHGDIQLLISRLWTTDEREIRKTLAIDTSKLIHELYRIALKAT